MPKCVTPMCPRSARIAKYCPDCALPDHADLAADGVYLLYTGRFTTVLSGVLVTQGPIDGTWPSYAAATAFLEECRKQAAPVKRGVPRRKAIAPSVKSEPPVVKSAPASVKSVPRRRKAPLNGVV